MDDGTRVDSRSALGAQYFQYDALSRSCSRGELDDFDNDLIPNLDAFGARILNRNGPGKDGAIHQDTALLFEFLVGPHELVSSACYDLYNFTGNS